VTSTIDTGRISVSQGLPLREQLKALENLQEIDLKIDDLKKKKTALPSALKALDDNMGSLRSSIDGKTRLRDEAEKNQRQTQAAMDLNRDRQTRASQKLEAVQNSHEFQAASKEIEQLKKLSATLEEQSKKAGGESETLGKEIGELTAKMDQLKTEREEQAGLLSGQAGKLESEIGTLTSERAQFTAKVEPRILSQYDRVRAARAGLGIVPAIGGRCKGCNMMVPPQLFIEIQRCNQIHQCPSCHRILFVAAPPQAESGLNA